MTPSEFKAAFPDGEFNSLTDQYIQTFLTRAANQMNEARWGRWYSEGLANCTAHFIVRSKSQAAKSLAPDAGDVTEKHVGPVGLSKDGQLLNAQARDPFMSTTYGQQYVFLRQLVGTGGAVTGEPVDGGLL